MKGDTVTTIEVLDEISRCFDGCSDYRIAKLLKCKPQNVSTWRSGRSCMSSLYRLRAAKLLERDPLTELLHGEIERAKYPEQKDLYQWAYRQLKERVHALILLITLPFIFSPVNVEAKQGWQPEGDNIIYYAHYGSGAGRHTRVFHHGLDLHRPVNIMRLRVHPVVRDTDCIRVRLPR